MTKIEPVIIMNDASRLIRSLRSLSDRDRYDLGYAGRIGSDSLSACNRSLRELHSLIDSIIDGSRDGPAPPIPKEESL